MTISSSTIDNKQPIRCLVIQLARLGDTLQSLMALRAAKQLYPLFSGVSSSRIDLP